METVLGWGAGRLIGYSGLEYWGRGRVAIAAAAAAAAAVATASQPLTLWWWWRRGVHRVGARYGQAPAGSGPLGRPGCRAAPAGSGPLGRPGCRAAPALETGMRVGVWVGCGCGGFGCGAGCGYGCGQGVGAGRRRSPLTSCHRRHTPRRLCSSQRISSQLSQTQAGVWGKVCVFGNGERQGSLGNGVGRRGGCRLAFEIGFGNGFEWAFGFGNGVGQGALGLRLESGESVMATAAATTAIAAAAAIVAATSGGHAWPPMPPRLPPTPAQRRVGPTGWLSHNYIYI